MNTRKTKETQNLERLQAALSETLPPNLGALETIHHRTYVRAEAPHKSETHAGVSIPESTLPVLDVSPTPEGTAEYTLGTLLGQGGTARVETATQRSLSREVAIKSLHEEHARHSSASASLLHEARITGFLEHPHIVPVHVLGQDSDGTLRLVMKRIEGTAWNVLLSQHDHPLWPVLLEEWGDRLEVHLQILIRVSAALHFAHERGIMHRDIKPANVMVGQYGEVYLVDWGIAERIEPVCTTTEETDENFFGAPREPFRVVGTPAYMAPEMLNGHADERSDVYLLGATLHMLLTGKPRHEGKNLLQMMFTIAESEPIEYPSEIPATLAAVANRATAKTPGHRYPSVQAFRRSITAFLRHRSSERLRVAADEQRQKLEETPFEEADGLTKAQAHYGSCAFSYQIALKEWPDNPRAREGLNSAIESMAYLEIRARNADAAKHLISEHPNVPRELIEAYEALRQTLQQDADEAAAQKRLLRHIDPQLGRRARGLFILFMAAVSSATSAAVLWAVPNAEALAEQGALMLAFGTLGLVTLLTFGFRNRLRDNPHHRKWTGFMNVSIWVITGHRLLAVQFNTPMHQILTTDLLLVASLAATAGVLLDRRMLGLALLPAAGVLTCILVPSWTLMVIALLFGPIFFPVAYIAWTPKAIG